MAGRYADAVLETVMRPDPKPPYRAVAFAPLPPARPRSATIRGARGGRRVFRASAQICTGAPITACCARRSAPSWRRAPTSKICALLKCDPTKISSRAFAMSASGDSRWLWCVKKFYEYFLIGK